MASRRKRGPVAFRPRLSAGLAFSLLSLNSSPNGKLVQSVSLIWVLFDQTGMSASGHKQSFGSLSLDWLVSARSGRSAFHSPDLNWAMYSAKVSFKNAAITESKNAE